MPITDYIRHIKCVLALKYEIWSCPLYLCYPFIASSVPVDNFIVGILGETCTIHVNGAVKLGELITRVLVCCASLNEAQL